MCPSGCLSGCLSGLWRVGDQPWSRGRGPLALLVIISHRVWRMTCCLVSPSGSECERSAARRELVSSSPSEAPLGTTLLFTASPALAAFRNGVREDPCRQSHRGDGWYGVLCSQWDRGRRVCCSDSGFMCRVLRVLLPGGVCLAFSVVVSRPCCDGLLLGNFAMELAV